MSGFDNVMGQVVQASFANLMRNPEEQKVMGAMVDSITVGTEHKKLDLLKAKHDTARHLAELAATDITSTKYTQDQLNAALKMVGLMA